jgi:uncharacterized protein YjbI with pentapeptide repeats
VGLDGCTALTTFIMSSVDHQCRSLDFSSSPLLSAITIGKGALETVSFRGCAAMTALSMPSYNLKAVDLAGMTALTTLNLSGTLLKFVDLSGLSSLDTADLSGAQLEEVAAAGAAPNGLNLAANDLTTDAVYAMLRAMGSPAAPGAITLTGNPCVAAGVLLDGERRTAASRLALATSLDYTLVLD